MTTLIMLSNTGLQYLVQGIQVITPTLSESRLTDSAAGMFYISVSICLPFMKRENKIVS